MLAKELPVVKHRIESIDILRGIIMLIMAIDHIRDYFHLGHPEPTDLAVTTPILFFTRWITHFCAPTFVFLSGVSAYLAGMRRTKKELSIFLIKRGLWLIFVEFAIITLAMRCDPGYHVLIFQVIWAIGGSMVLLGLLVWAPLPVIGIIGAIIFFGHNIFDYVDVGTIGKNPYWRAFISANGFSSVTPVGHGHFLMIAYALLPWTGVMLIGYVFGSLYKRSIDAARRRKILLITGLSLFALFLLLRAFNIYGDPAPWSVQKTIALSIISFFNVTKYPCSLVYLSMTLGVTITILSLSENIKNKFTAILIVYGNVPFFYYVCHWYLIRFFMLIVLYLQGFTYKDMAGFSLKGFGYSLGGVYVLWIIVIVTLYFPCRWFGQYKKTHTQWWLSYL